jgi:putative endonuclease
MSRPPPFARSENSTSPPSSSRAAALPPTSPGERRMVGGRGEDIAAAWIEALGWPIAARNVQFRCGELDIVAWDGDQLVFVEVRARVTGTGLLGAHTVMRAKQQRLIRAAQLYVQRHVRGRFSSRFDVMSVDLVQGRVVEHFRGAFDGG